MPKLLTTLKDLFKNKRASKYLGERIKEIENGIESLQKETEGQFNEHKKENPALSIQQIRNIFTFQKETLSEVYLKELNDLNKNLRGSNIGSEEKKQMKDLYEKINNKINSLKNYEPEKPERNNFGLIAESQFKVKSYDNFDTARTTFNPENNTFKTLMQNTSRNKERTKPKKLI